MERVKRALPFLLTGLLVITLFVVQFVVFTPNGTADMKAFWTRLAINVFLLVTAAFIWWGGGMDQAKQEEKSAYRTNSTLYGKKVSAMADDGRLRQFREYCKQKTDELRTSKEKAQLLRVGIDRKQYEELKSLTVEELRQKGYISKQIRAIRKVREGRVKVREINPMELMTDSKARDEYDVHYDEKAERTAWTVRRVIRATVTAAFMAFLMPGLSEGITNITVWSMFLLQLLTITCTAFRAYRDGYIEIAETKNKIILRRIALLDEFEEWAAVPRLPAPGNK